MPKKIKTIKDLSFDEKNINKGSEYGTALLNKSLQEVGAGRSVLADKNGVLIAGNKTIESAGQLGITKIKVVETTGDEIVVVQRTDLDINSAAGAKMKILDNTVSKHNYIEDAEVMEAVCEEYELEAADLGLTVDAKQEVTEDDYEMPDDIKTDIVTGDLFEIGQHRLLCGDSTNADDVARLMKGEEADMVFTDPPYGMKLNPDYEYVGNSTIGLREGKKYAKILGDEKEFDFISAYNLFEKCKEQFWFGADYYCQQLPKNGGWIVWDKTGGNDSLMNAGLGSNFELCWTKQGHKRDLFRITYKGVCGIDKNDGKRKHPTQKPVRLYSEIINRWGKKANIIIDLFLGSGTTMVAAHQLNRKCYGMEIDTKYCQVIIDRMLKLDASIEIKKNGQPYAPKQKA